MQPNARKQALIAQAGRIEPFLASLASDDALLLAYIKDPVAVLTVEVTAGNLWLEDAALLLEGSYERVADVMSQSSGGGVIWHVVWHF
jgi:hypothetical protein